METKKRTQLIMIILNVLFWITFIGLCIKTGSLLYSFFVSLVINPIGSHNLYMGLDLSELHHFSMLHYIIMGSLLIIFNGLKAYIAYLVIKVSMKFKIDQPFNAEVVSFISKISYIALEAGILALVAEMHTKYLNKTGVNVPIEWGSGEILLFAGVIFIIAQVFKRGIEIQSENELTI